MTLRLLKKNQRATITAVTLQGVVGLRLREMGLIPGTRITVEGRAPLHDPVRLRINGQVLTLRNREADGIEVSTEE